MDPFNKDNSGAPHFFRDYLVTSSRNRKELETYENKLQGAE